MKKILLAMFAGLFILSGCATIVGDSTQQIDVNSTPDQANFVIKDETGAVIQQGVTPAQVVLKKSSGKYFGRKDYTIEFSKKGFEPVSYELKNGANGWYIAGNLVFGGVIGWLAVDPFNGGMYTISPDSVNQELAPAK